VNSHQASLYASGKPAVVGSFARAVRRPLDDTSWVEVVPGWLSGWESLLIRLVASVPFEQRRRWMYNRLVDEPRLTAEYADREFRCLISGPRLFADLYPGARPPTRGSLEARRPFLIIGNVPIGKAVHGATVHCGILQTAV
jgi:hypothetical protein